MFFNARAGRRLVAGAVVIAGLLSMTATGCDSASSTSGNANAAAGQRAQYVETMLSNSYASGPETESGIMSVIAGYGGGYVTDAQLADAPGAAEKLTLTVVMGAGRVTNSMQGEKDFDPAAPGCYTLTVGYYSYSGKAANVSCPSSLTTANAQATAERQITNQITSEQYDGSVTAIPQTLGDAVSVSNVVPKTPVRSGAPETGVPLPGRTTGKAAAPPPVPTAADFATGTDPVEHLPDAALAVPQANGGCVYIVYRWLKSSWITGGHAGSANKQVATAWAAPTGAPCTGPAALAGSGFLTVDTFAGG